MQDRKISAAFVWAYGLWVTAIGLFVIGWVVESPPIRCLSVIIAMAGATATVRSYLIAQVEQIKTAIAVTATVPSDSVTPLSRNR